MLRANFPFDAVEEALVNAVYHRSDEGREPVEVQIGREDLVVLSYPGQDRSVKSDALPSGAPSDGFASLRRHLPDFGEVWHGVRWLLV